jgi:hypothetical protein
MFLGPAMEAPFIPRIENMTNPNDSAFAHWSPTGQQAGLTKREYFAAMAMQAFIPESDEEYFNYAAIAMHSVYQADALIAALNKEGE